MIPSLAEFKVEWSWKWSNPGSDKSEPECQSTSCKNHLGTTCVGKDEVSHFLLLSPGSSSTTESTTQAVASVSCLPPSLTTIPTSSNGHFSIGAVEKNPSHLLPPPIPPSSKDFFGLCWLGWREWEAHPWIFHQAERMKRKVCRQSHKTRLVLKETATFLVGKKEHSDFQPVNKALWLGRRVSGYFQPTFTFTREMALMGRNVHGNMRVTDWSSHGDACQTACLFPVRCGRGGNLFSSCLSWWSMTCPTAA